MSLARCTVLLALVLVLMPGIAAAESPASPAVLGKELVRVLPQGPPGFTVVQADETPSVTVEGFRGYRIVLRQEYYEFPDFDQQMATIGVPTQTTVRMVSKEAHIDLVLFPDLSEVTVTRPSTLALFYDTKKVTSGLKDRIKWLDLAQAYFVKPVYMGKGHGYYWFGRTTISRQDWVRRRMELTGGDDRVALAIEGMEVIDEGMMTRNSVYAIFRDLGDAAVPALQAVIKKHENEEPGRYISQLNYIDTEKSTALLRSLYHSTNPEVSNKAALSLTGFSTRSSAKPEYLDMLRRRVQTVSVAEICAKYGWKEAVPDLEAIMASPPSWWDFNAAYLAHRSLSGRPVETLVQAVDGLVSQGKVSEDAQATLAGAQDKEAVAVLMIGQYGRSGKMTREDHEARQRLVLDLLRGLPPEIVRPLVEHAVRSMTDKYDKERLTKLLGELKGMVDS